VNTLSYKTISANKETVQKEWVVVDAQGEVLGRLASQIAALIRGKHKTNFTPHVDCGDYVVVINADKVKFTGKKMTDKDYYRHTGHPGGIKHTTPQRVLSGRFPERVLEKAVERMLPKESPLARKQMTHLRIFAGAKHAHVAQSPEPVAFAEMNSKNVRSA